ncbi:MAG: FAD-binding oxidoreductase [Chloroflexi bacterium]|nr:FAD-binding oxidoreductase [Chloroflexota bacterium]
MIAEHVTNQVITPETPEQLAQALKSASDERRAVIPLGGGTMLDLGGPVARAALGISLAKLNNVLDYQPANLTVRAQAGVTLDALNAKLAQHGQYLPLDPPCPSRATLGGILATNASGPLRMRYGAARDLLIGIRVALTDGQIVHGGGQVVKNVAGYDLPKLFIGSLGTLGIILEATFKLAPLPKQTSTLVAHFDDLAHALAVALRALQSPLQPMSVELLDRTASAQFGLDDSASLAVRFGGIESAIARQLGDVEKWSRESGALKTATIVNDAALWARVRDFSANHPTVVKVGVLPTQIAEIGSAAQEIARQHEVSCALVAHAVGILFIALDGDQAQMLQAIGKIGDVAHSLRGHLILQRAPRSLRERVDTWGRARSDWNVMQKLKREFDPNGVLNQGSMEVWGYGSR